MKLLSMFIIFFATACSSNYSKDGYGVFITEKLGVIHINSYSKIRADFEHNKNLGEYSLFFKKNGKINFNFYVDSNFCNADKMEGIENYIAKLTENEPNSIINKYYVNVYLAAAGTYSYQFSIPQGENSASFILPLESCDDTSRIFQLYYLAVHELKHIDLIQTGEFRNLDVAENEFLATKAASCSLVLNSNFKSLEIYDAKDEHFHYVNNNTRPKDISDSELGSLLFHARAGEVVGVGVILNNSQKHRDIKRWCGD